MTLMVWDIISVLQQRPYATLFILSIAASISLLTTLVNRLITNPAKSKDLTKRSH